jgi:hypothetical protein
VPPPDSGDELNAASPSNPIRPLDRARPEDHRAQRRVQPIRPDHQVETPPVAGREDHVDPIRVLSELGDPVAEDVLDTVAGVAVQHP